MLGETPLSTLAATGIVAAAAVGALEVWRWGAGTPPPVAPPSTLESAPVLSRSVSKNPTAHIPPQCYTKTQDGRSAHNPCYVCHQSPLAPNFVDDEDLQLSHAFPEPARVNPWTNLFVDRRPAMAEISDEAVLAHVRRSNYFDPEGAIEVAHNLAGLPEGWDYDGDDRWSGYVPDAYFEFDDEGFDRDPEGRLTGWRAFAYYPFPGTFWPTNGSAGDVLIRLPEVFRNDATGVPSRETYRINLAVVEALIRRRDVAVNDVDERAHRVDLDGDGQLSVARRVRYDWAPLQGKHMSFVGQARAEQDAGRLVASAGLFPEGTEFLHSVRYLDVRDGAVHMAERMKELRYAKKTRFLSYSELEARALSEAREKIAFPQRVRQVVGNSEYGVDNGLGWRLGGFVENEDGYLRPQSYEELSYCVGCHSGVGATTDSMFSFARKLDSAAWRRGWYHWSQRDLRGLAEPRRGDGRYEYTTYLEQVGGGDELRANDEVRARFFDGEGRLRNGPITQLHEDVSLLLLPSPERALALNKAYWLVVREQSFAKGRDAVLRPALNVLRQVGEDPPTGVARPERPAWAPALALANTGHPPAR